MFAAPFARATVMHYQRRPSTSNLPSSSAIHATIMANVTSQSQRESNKAGAHTAQNQAPVTAAKPVSKYINMDPQMFIDSPFVGGAMLSPTSSAESTSSQPKTKTSSSFNLKYFNPSNDPRLLAM